MQKQFLLAQQYVDCVLVVDDGSTDATGEIAKKMGAMVVRHTKNLGYGAALKTIFEKAKKHDIDALVIIDSDGQHNPNDIPKLLDRLGKGDVDVVIGSRFIQGNAAGNSQISDFWDEGSQSSNKNCRCRYHN